MSLVISIVKWDPKVFINLSPENSMIKLEFIFSDTENFLSPKDSESQGERYSLLRGQDTKDTQLFGWLIQGIISNSSYNIETNLIVIYLFTSPSGLRY